MVNASLNWASIVGIVLAVCGGGLYFLRSFKPALARDYDVFFAAIGLLCGGILFFQGWRLDPILQFGQFLLAGTTVFFAYESVRLRGVATDQARRSSYFEDEQIPNVPRNSSRNRFDDDYEQFEDGIRSTRRFKPQEDELQDEYDESRSRRNNLSRAIPESAVSRRRVVTRGSDQFANENLNRRRNRSENRTNREINENNFGERRSSVGEVRRGSRPSANKQVAKQSDVFSEKDAKTSSKSTARPSVRSQTKRETVDASFQNINEVKKPRQSNRSTTTRRSTSGRSTTTKNQSGRYTINTNKKRPRDNTSRFDD